MCGESEKISVLIPSEISAVLGRGLFPCMPGLSLAVQVLHRTHGELQRGAAPLPNMTQSTCHSRRSYHNPLGASSHPYIHTSMFNRTESQLQLHTV